jgi:hypothetical protein
MTTFKEIRGTTIEVLSSDPSNPETGQIWYNSSSGTLKGYLLANVNAWSSAPTANNGRSYTAGTGTQTATLIFGGDSSSPSSAIASESFNGSAWTNTPSLNTAGYARNGAGTQTATVITSSYTATTASEKWNGTSWTSGNSMNSGQVSRFCFGTQTAAIAAGGGAAGVPSGTSLTSVTESYNGTSWTNTPYTINTARRGNQGSAGISTAGLIFGGFGSSPPGFDVGSTASESFNGSAWTTTASMNNAVRLNAGFGTQTAAVGAGGTGTSGSPVYNYTEIWNGTAWTNNPTGLSTARNGSASAGTRTAGIVATGYNGTAYVGTTELWTGSALQTKTITVS